MRHPSNPKTLKALIALALALGATEMRFCYGGDGPHEPLVCPDCGAPGTWQECEGCNGQGFTGCICEGGGGEISCSQDCFARSCV